MRRRLGICAWVISPAGRARCSGRCTNSSRRDTRMRAGDLKICTGVMMEEVLWGCDVMPSAIHITGATLSGVHPNVQFGGSRLYTLPYGRQRDGSVAIGSLELLQSSTVMTLINTTDPALADW